MVKACISIFDYPSLRILASCYAWGLWGGSEKGRGKREGKVRKEEKGMWQFCAWRNLVNNSLSSFNN